MICAIALGAIAVMCVAIIGALFMFSIEDHLE